MNIIEELVEFMGEREGQRIERAFFNPRPEFGNPDDIARAKEGRERAAHAGCADCNGTLYRSEECHECHGTGTISIRCDNKKNTMNVCHPCGLTANYLTCLKRYGQPPLKPCFDVSTYHRGTCGVCKRETEVTEERDFFYPDFSILEATAKRLASKKPSV